MNHFSVNIGIRVYIDNNLTDCVHNNALDTLK